MKTTVSFHGPQGSGKTVLSRAFREFLSARGVLVTLLDPDDRRDAADNFSVEVETDDLLGRLEAFHPKPGDIELAARRAGDTVRVDHSMMGRDELANAVEAAVRRAPSPTVSQVCGFCRALIPGGAQEMREHCQRSHGDGSGRF